MNETVARHAQISARLVALRSSVAFPLVHSDGISSSALSVDPDAAARSAAVALCDQANGGKRRHAELLAARLRNRRSELTKRCEVNRRMALRTIGMRIDYERKSDRARSPKIIELSSMVMVNILAPIALAGAVLNVAYSLKALNPVLYELPLAEVVLMATPLLLAAKAGYLASISIPDPRLLRRLGLGLLVGGTLSFLAWLVLLCTEINASAAAGSLSYSSAPGAVDWSLFLPGMRLFAQLSSEVAFTCAISVGMKLLLLRGRKLIVEPTEVSKAWALATSETEAEVDQLDDSIEVCEEIISIIDTHKGQAVDEAVGRVRALIERADGGADAARISIINSHRSGNSTTQLRLV